MKLIQNENTVLLDDNSGQGQSKQMTIALSAKAFDILSSSLYKNKVRAIIRELSTNAWDAHVAAGNLEQPFEIQLPTNLDPTFYIRDYGTGMDEQTVFEVYNSLFASTKTATNDQAGCLGLGSKTPFSYTDQVTVTSIQDGTLKVYNIMKGNDGIPTLAKMAELSTDEPNGLKVQFAVNNQDCNSFLNEAEFVFTTFISGPPPKLLNTNLDARKLSGQLSRLSSNLLAMTRSSRYGYLSIIQGNVCYPVEREFLNEDLKNSLNHIDSGAYSYFIEVPIGTVDFTPSREALTGSKENYARLTPHLLHLEEHITQYFKDALGRYTQDDYTARWFISERRQAKKNSGIFSEYFFRKLCDENGLDGREIVRDAQYQTPDIKDLVDSLGLEVEKGYFGKGSYAQMVISLQTIREDEPDTSQPPVPTRQLKKGVPHNWSVGHPSDYETVDVYPMVSVHKSSHLMLANLWKSSSRTEIVLVDEKSAFRARMKSHYSGCEVARIVVKNYLQAPQDAAKLISLLPHIKVVKTSEIPNTRAAAGIRKAPKKQRWFVPFGKHESLANSELQTIEDMGMDPEDIFYYVVKSGDVTLGVDYGPNLVDDLFAEGIICSKNVVVIGSQRNIDKLLEVYPNAESLGKSVRNWFRDNYSYHEIRKLAKFSNHLNPSGGGSRQALQALFGKLTAEETESYFLGKKWAYFLTKSQTNLYDTVGRFFKVLDTVYREEHSKENSILSATADLYKRLENRFPLVTSYGRLDYNDKARRNALKLMKLKRREEND